MDTAKHMHNVVLFRKQKQTVAMLYRRRETRIKRTIVYF